MQDIIISTFDKNPPFEKFCAEVKSPRNGPKDKSYLVMQ